MMQANFSFQYADPHFGGLLAATYLPQAPVSKTFASYISSSSGVLAKKCNPHVGDYLSVKSVHQISSLLISFADMQSPNGRYGSWSSSFTRGAHRK